jgi:hypothetical protein
VRWGYIQKARLFLVRARKFVLYGISGPFCNVGQCFPPNPFPSCNTPPPPPPPLPPPCFDNRVRQLCDFSAFKQQQQSSKHKHEANTQASGRASAPPVPGSTSPAPLRPRSQHGSGKFVSSNGHAATSPSKNDTSPIARNTEHASPLRLSSPNSPPLTHKNYKVRRD